MNWNQKIFLYFNERIGRSVFLDRFFLYSAHYLIYGIIIISLLWVIYDLGGSNPVVVINYFKFAMSAGVLGFLTSYFFALFIHHPRPGKVLSKVKTLFQPIENWKSFPSDHTLISFIFVGLAIIFGAPYYISIVLVLLGLTVGISRVYCGVHYPVDIIGGIIFGLVFSFLAENLVLNITEPLYQFFLKDLL